MTYRGSFKAVVLSILVSLLFAGAARADDPAFRASPGSYDFGDRVIGEEYVQYDSIYVSPISEAEVVITGIEIVGPDAEDFDFTLGSDACYGEPLSDYMCDIYPTFTSDDEVGVKTAAIEITSNAPLKTIPLKANVVEAATNGPALDPLEPQDAYAPSQTNDQTTYGMGTADFNGDGRTDVASAGQDSFFGSFVAAVAFGQADGTFGTPVALGQGGGIPNSVVIGDFDGEDGPDILVPGNAADIYLNDGEGGFTTGIAIGTGGGSFASPGDFNNDGDLDVAITGFDTTEIYLNNGDATFTKTAEDVTFQGQAMGVTQTEANFRGTGTSGDFAVATYEGRVLAFLSDGDGTFTAAPSVRPGGCGCIDLWGISATDVNSDGRSDLSVSGSFNYLTFTLLGQADGTLLLSQVIPTPLFDGGEAPAKMVGNGDVNGDGIPELFVTDYYSDSLMVATGLESGIGFAFAEQIATTDQSFGSSQVSTGDINGDGKQDVILGGEWGLVMPVINVGEPNPVPDPESVDFGDVKQGFSSDPRTVTLSNEDGIAPMVVSGIQTAGGSSADFVVASTTCMSGPILVGDSCSAEVIFDPIGPPEELESSLYFQVNVEGDNQVEVPLSGTVVPGSFSIEATPTSVEFGDVTVGQAAASRNVVIANNGDYSIEIEQPVIEGDDASDFTISDGCDEVVLEEAGDLCTIEVGFTPGSTGARNASISIPGVELESPLEVDLTGTGVPVPAPGIAVQPGIVAFPATEVGSESGARTITITSSGTAPLALGAVGVSGTGAGSFSVDSTACAGKTLAPGASCAISARFKPSAAAAFAGNVTVASNAGAATSVPLTGTGTAKPIPPVKPPKVSFKKKPKKKYVIKTKKLKKLKIAFKSNQSGSKFQCKFDRKKFSGCKSPKVYKNIKPGKHSIRVRAKKAGKTGSAKVVKFKVVRKKK